MVAAQLIDFSRGNPPIDVFPIEDLAHAAESSVRNDPHVLLQYGHSPGYKPLRELLGSWHGVGPEQVLVANSSLEIVEFVARTMLGPGRRAFVESPCYDRAITTFRRAGAEVVGIPLEADGIDLARLEREIHTGAPALFYTVADFQNPTGCTTSLAKRREIARLAERHGFWIIEDAPYRQLRYWGEAVPTFYSIAPERVFYLSSFSKILAPGLRLGYVISTPEAVMRLAGYAVDTYIGPVFPTEGLVYEYCRAGHLQPNIERLKAVYRPRLTACLEALSGCLPDATWSRPEGGFFVGVTLPEGASVGQMLTRAAGAGLKLSDGRGFFAAPSEGERFVRIPFCGLAPDEIHEGIARVARII